MLLFPISLAILVSSAILNIATSAPLSETQPSPEVEPFQPNTLIHGLPDDIFLNPSPIDSPPLEFYESNKFGLWPSGHTPPEKTVLLNNGQAKFDATFTLLLRTGEYLKGMRHRPNDTSIITSFEESRERHVEHFVSYNITITHHFEGTVGVAEYELTIFTTKGTTLHQTGIYFVSGVVVYASTHSKPLTIVSGVPSPPLSVESVYSFSHMSGNGHVMLPVKFQQVGPDVSWRPANFADVLPSANITVTNMPSDDMPILISNSFNCNAMYNKVSIRKKGNNDWENCDVRFDSDSMSLVLRLHPERYGKAIINIAFPALQNDLEEEFRTEIRLKISKPAILRPELVMKQDLHLQLDYYGTESFTLQMKNDETSDHQRKVVSYVVDLPGNRYATADFTSSSLAGPVQNISFTVVSPGQENKMLQKKIRHALMLLADITKDKDAQAALVKLRRTALTNQSHFFRGLPENTRASMPSFDLSSLALYADEYPRDLEVISVSQAQGKTQAYRSHVHAVFPSFDELVTAQSSSGSALRTALASKELAVVEALRVRTDRQNLLVKLILLRYTISTFSQHKSMQISMYLSKEISMLFRDRIETATLVMLEDRSVNIEASYHVLIPQKHVISVMDLNKHKKKISSSMASNLLLKDGRLKISDIIRLAVLGRPIGVNMTNSVSPPQYKGVSGTIVTVFVVLAVVIAIPLLSVCIGCILARRFREEESSNFDDNSAQELIQEDDKDKKSREDCRVATDVLRDNYGRGDEDNSESFRVRTEMTKEGYFGDNVCSRKEQSESLTKS